MKTAVCSALLIFGGFPAFGQVVRAVRNDTPTQSFSPVILRAAGDTVQMFDSMGADATSEQTIFQWHNMHAAQRPHCATCRSGISMQFYKLNWRHGRLRQR